MPSKTHPGTIIVFVMLGNTRSSFPFALKSPRAGLSKLALTGKATEG
jgi:hypothetical protein